MPRTYKCILVCSLAAALAACTIHPRGEYEERAAAAKAGREYDKSLEARDLPILTPDASVDQLVAYAQLSNADLERQYWQWRSALEQIPQEGTQKTNLAITYSNVITEGMMAGDSNVLGFGNDAASNIMLPGKLSTAAKIALEQARAEGKRFNQARFDLRSKVLTAYAEYARTAEMIRLEQANLDLLTLISRATESRVGTGAARQQDMLKVSNDVELSKNDLAALKAQLPGQLAMLNALLNRDVNAAIDPPKVLPAERPLSGDDVDILQAAAQQNSELKALAIETAGKREAIRRAKLEYQPEFGLNISTDLAGTTQTLMGSVMVPVLRYQAIDAGVRQSEDNLRAAEATQRQAAHDLAARLQGDLSLIRDLDRQIDVYTTIILPRTERVVSATQNSFSTGQDSMIDLLDAQRSLISLRRMLAEFRTSRAKQLADAEAAAVMVLTKAQ